MAAEPCRYADQRVLTARCGPLSPPYFNSGRVGGLICAAGPTKRNVNVTDAPVASVNGTLPATKLAASAPGAALNIGAVMGTTLGLLGAAALLGFGGYAIYRHYFLRDRGEQNAAHDGILDL